MIRNLIVILSLVTLKVEAQSDTIILLNQRLTSFDNGNPKVLVTYNSDSCEYIDEVGLIEFIDYCRDGEYKEWYKNGHLKICGYYDYDIWRDTIVKTDPVTGEMIYNEVSYWQSYKTGLWYEYDSIGKIGKVSRYINNRLVAIKTNATDSVISAVTDSVGIQAADYSKINRYLINRSKTNKKLILYFPTHATHNYWRIYDYRTNLFLGDYHPNSIYFWPKGIVELIADDSCGNHCKNYFDFNNLTAGEYFVYYWSYIGTFHEIKVTINDI